MGKAAGSVTIIGGSDGPTSVFLLGNKHKEKNLLKRIKHAYYNIRHQYKIKRAKKSVKPGVHTINETICYMKEHFGMKETDQTDLEYEENRKGMRFAIMQREHSDLLPKQPKTNDFQNVEAVTQWQTNMKVWEKEVEAIIEKLPQEVLDIDYHQFVLDKGKEGSLQVEVEMNRELIETQYSGKGFQTMVKDIYLYYGVSKEDVLNKTERYHNLVMILAQ